MANKKSAGRLLARVVVMKESLKTLNNLSVEDLSDKHKGYAPVEGFSACFDKEKERLARILKREIEQAVEMAEKESK